jgi:5-methylcytosine-specific restriction endonuclease McrA
MKIPFVFKKCNKCGRWLVANTVNFHRDKFGKYGLKAQCKECVSAYKKEYYEENKEERREYSNKYNEENKEERREYDKKRYEENKEKIAERHKQYYEENKEELIKRSRKYREENKEELAEKRKIYYKTPQGQVVTFNGNTKRRKREQRGNGITPDQWLEMMKYFDWKCAYSGKSINVKENRSIDHIVPLAKGGAHEVWNLVPMYRPYNSSKNDKDIKEWYLQQDFYDEDRLNKINEWRKYSYNKWGKEVNTKAI